MFKGFSKLAAAGVFVCAAAVFSVAASEVLPIRSLDDLQKIGRDADYPLNGHYILENDIDLSPTKDLEEDGSTFDGRGWRPIGVSVAGYNRCGDAGNGDNCAKMADTDSMFVSGAFSGTFDGNGRTISGLYVDRTLPISEGDGDGSTSQQHHLSAGLFAVLRGATVKNLTIEADTVAVHGRFAMHSSAAGILAGFSYNATITGVHTKGTVVGIGRPPASGGATVHLLGAGGLVGKDEWSDISNSSSEVALSSVMAEVPDVWGNAPNNKVGGLAGIIEFSTIAGCYAKTEIRGVGYHAGGLVGESNGGTITKSGASAVGQSLRITTVGGLVGANKRQNGPSCPGCYDGNTKEYRGTIEQSYSTVNLNRLGGSGEYGEIGGLVGQDQQGIIRNSYSIGTITCNAAAESDIYMGGLVGHSLRFWINVSGWADGTVPLSQNNYAAVSITSSEHVKASGGLVGWRNPYYDAEEDFDFYPFMRSYWDTELTSSGGISTNSASGGAPVILPGVSGGGSGKSAAEMKQQGTFEGWDFENIWRINEGENYPYLAWQSGNPTSISRGSLSRGVNKNKLAPRITVRGKTLNVKASSSTENLQISLIDVRGRTLRKFNTTGSGSFSLNKIPAGRYIVDMKNMDTNKRIGSTAVVVR